jgi:hypothetical protein
MRPDGFTKHHPEREAVSLPVGMRPCGEGFRVIHERKNEHDGKPIKGAFVEFINVGQTMVWLNSGIPIPPDGGYYSLANPCFDATWVFYPVADPPRVNGKSVQEGNNLIVIVHKNKGSVADLKRPGGTSSAGGGGAALTDVTPETDGGYTDADFSITAGKTEVEVNNVGGISPKPITIAVGANSFTVPVGQSFRRKSRTDGANRYLLPAINVVTNGSHVYYNFDTNPLL